MSTKAELTRRVVVADDEPAIIALISAMLEGNEVKVALDLEFTSDGEEAVEACRTNPPDVLLLDARMPGMDGFEACRILKGDERTAGIRIVMVTAFTQESDRQRSHAAGADAFLGKPFSTEQLVEVLGFED